MTLEQVLNAVEVIKKANVPLYPDGNYHTFLTPLTREALFRMPELGMVTKANYRTHILAGELFRARTRRYLERKGKMPSADDAWAKAVRLEPDRAERDRMLGNLRQAGELVVAAIAAGSLSGLLAM